MEVLSKEVLNSHIGGIAQPVLTENSTAMSTIATEASICLLREDDVSLSINHQVGAFGFLVQDAVADACIDAVSSVEPGSVVGSIVVMLANIIGRFVVDYVGLDEPLGEGGRPDRRVHAVSEGEGGEE